jgi:hypothetical protein
MASLVTAGVLSVTSAGAKRADDCTWGASSITAEYVEGKLVVSEPVTTGCVPG